MDSVTKFLPAALHSLVISSVIGLGLSIPAQAGAATWANGDFRALPCRPTIACTADLVPPGGIELEAGYLLRLLGRGGLQHSSPFLLKLTLATWVQLQVGSNGGVFAGKDSSAPASYLDDMILGVKFHFHDQSKAAPSLSFSAALSVPTFEPQLGYTRSYEVLLGMYISKDIRWLHIDLNTGLTLWRLEQTLLIQGFAALALSVELPRRFGAMLEWYGFAAADPIAPADAGLLFGPSFSPVPWLMLDTGVDIGLVQATRKLSFFLGFTIFPIKLWGGR